MLRNTQGRYVGIGISYDRYDEESDAGRTSHRRFGEVRMPNWKKEDISTLSGPCITIVPARKEVVACTSTQI